MMRTALVLAAFLVPAGAARAEVVVGSTIEWLICEAEVVVVARVEKVVQTPVPPDIGSGVYHEITVVVKEPIKAKAKAGERIVFHLRTTRAQDDALPASWMRSREPTLLFLSTSKNADHNIDGKLVPTGHQLSWGVDLDAPGKTMFDAKGAFLVKKDAILAACRSTAEKLAAHLKAHPNGRVASKTVDAGNSAAGEVLYAGSVVLLKVPDFVTGDKK